MRNQAEDEQRMGRGRRVPLALPVLLALGVAGCVLAACGSPSATRGSAGVAQLGSTTTTAPAAVSATPEPFQGIQQEYQYELSYAACMRTHGVPGFPDPVLSSHSLRFNNSADSSSPNFKSADNACRHLLPNNGGFPTAAQIAAESSRLLQYAQCMRANGEPNFSDPTINSHEIGFSLKGVDPSSPQFRTAQQKCSALAPGGVQKGAH